MSESKTVEVCVTLGTRDVQRANFYIARSSIKWWRSLIISIVLSAVLFPGISLAYRDNKGLGWMAVIGVLFGVFLWLILTPLMMAFAYILSFWGARLLVRNNPHALGPITYQFSENGHTYAATNGKGEVLWAAYPKIYETRDSFLLFFVKNLAKVVPKRCFSGEPAVNELKDLLEKNFKGELRLVK